MAEIAVSSGLTAYDALEKSVRMSVQSGTALANGEPMAIFGITVPTIMSSVAYPWILTSTVVDSHKKAFLRMSREWVEQKSGEYSLLTQVIDSRYISACRWAEWLGFECINTITVGNERIPFNIYELRS